MQDHATSTARNGCVIASGYGLKIYVERGHLIVHDGIGADRQTRRYNRATSKLTRIIVLGQTGFVTLEAQRWLRDVGAALIQLDRDGQPVAFTAPDSPKLPALRRAQALAATSEAGLAVARIVLGEKLRGQAAVMRKLPPTARADAQLDQAIRDLDGAGDLQGLLAAELSAAGAYWKAWSAVGLPFPKSQAARLPAHWLTFGQRPSALTRTNREATNPANAILNYLYALLEAETTIACYAVGLDPGIGIFHADKSGRDSLALDVMEACRPVIDAYLLAWLSQRTLSPREFIETPKGACRLRPAMTEQLATTSLVWASHVAPIVERVAHLLGEPHGVPTATRLTQTNRKVAYAARTAEAVRGRPSLPALPATCRDCGAGVPNRRYRYCERCRRNRWTEHASGGRAAAAQVLEHLRDEGRDPAHGASAARRRGQKNAAHQAAVTAWSAAHGATADRDTFAAEIAPRLRAIAVRELAAATGLSEHYCSLIRLGKRVPHQRHWAALAALGAQSPTSV